MLSNFGKKHYGIGLVRGKEKNVVEIGQ